MKKALTLIFLASLALVIPNHASAQLSGCTALQHCAVLAWTDTANPTGTTYNVWRSTGACPTQSPTSTSGFTQVNTAAITAKTYPDTTVTGGATYCYLVTAQNGSNVSGPSNDAQGAIPLLFPPQTLSISATQ